MYRIELERRSICTRGQEKREAAAAAAVTCRCQF